MLLFLVSITALFQVRSGYGDLYLFGQKISEAQERLVELPKVGDHWCERHRDLCKGVDLEENLEISKLILFIYWPETVIKIQFRVDI